MFRKTNWFFTQNERTMKERKSQTLLYLSIILFLAFIVTFFKLTLNFIHILEELVSIYTSFPAIELIINFIFLYLLWLILLLYRRWKHEVTDHKRDEETLLSLKKAIDNMQIGVTISNAKGKIIYSNPADAEMHGYSDIDLFGTEARVFSPPEIWKPMPEQIQSTYKRESINVRKDGTNFPVYLMSDVVKNTKGEVLSIITICEDITDRKRNEEIIKKLAFYDTLTGLPNRSLFDDRLRQELAKARRHKRSLAIMFIDLDRFKFINDTFGHNTGDLFLQAVSKRLQDTMREGDTVSRLSGDEFLFLFCDINNTDAASVVANKILEKLSEVFVINNKEIYTTGSIGISIFPENGNDLESLVKNADAAMYHAKEQGRNNYQFYTPSINAYVMEKIKMESYLHKALQQKEFILHYQPEVDLKSGKVVGAEVLMRWHNLHYGLLPPMRFIPLAEETGLIQPIGEWIVRSACAQNKAWQEAGLPSIVLSVNVSMHQLKHKTFVKMLMNILEETNLESKYLELELTESAVMQDSDLALSTLNELKTLGINISIDDFGTGYSSLSYLKYLPLSKIKLDQSFLHSIAINPNDKSISKAIIAMSHSLGLKVIAEGVENVDQLEFLRSQKCDEAQGFLFSEPLAPQDFINWLGMYGESSHV